MEGQQSAAGDLSDGVLEETSDGALEETSDGETTAEGTPAGPTWLRRNSRRVALLSSAGLLETQSTAPGRAAASAARSPAPPAPIARTSLQTCGS